MANKEVSKSWLKHIALALVVLIGAIAVLLFMPEPDDSMQANKPKESTSIEENLADFYREFRLSSKDPIQAEYGDFVVSLELPEESQTERLVAISNVDKPPEETWQGEYKFRSFAKDTTIRVEAMKYAEEEGMQLIWDLNQDFIIRQRFLVENNLLGTLDEVAGAIDSNFIPEVNVYFCNKKRTIVISERAGTYVKENCQKTGFIN
ncbi:TcpQ domain-containing protein [Glaciecola sp. MF2-115]|uniref:TcpQ domain-containing protein n=1 Tax=Glaciecola sp. MF2-115 TaxID=3384827 RepID=UPI0039A1BFF1